MAYPLNVSTMFLCVFPAYARHWWKQDATGVAVDNPSADGDRVGEWTDPSPYAQRVAALSSAARGTYKIADGRGASIAFDGSTNHINVPNSKGNWGAILTSRTFFIQGWVKVNADNSLMLLFDCCQNSGANKGWLLSRTSTNKVQFLVANSGAILSATTSTQTLTAAMGWVRIRIIANAGAVSIQVGSQTAENFSYTGTAPAGTLATNDLEIGCVSSTLGGKLNGSLGDWVFDSAIPSGGNQTLIDAWNPAYTTVSLATITGSGSSLLPTAMSAVREIHDLSASGKAWQDTGGSVAASANNDPVRWLQSLAPGYNRDYLAAADAQRALYKTNAWNGLPGLQFDGTNHWYNMTSVWAAAAEFTYIAVVWNTRAGTGSHLLAGPTELPYVALTANDYYGNNNPAFGGVPYCYLHTSTGVGFSPGKSLNQSAPTIVAFSRWGSYWEGSILNVAGPGATGLATSCSFTTVGQDITRPEWMMRGYFFADVLSRHFFPMSAIVPVVNGYADAWGIPNVSRGSSARARRTTFGFGRIGSRTAA